MTSTTTTTTQSPAPLFTSESFGGHGYRAAAKQLLKAAGWKCASEGYVDTFTKGTAMLVAKVGSNGVLVSVIDKAGNQVVKPGAPLRWEALVQLGTTGKLVPATLKNVKLTKAQRVLVVAGKLTTLS